MDQDLTKSERETLKAIWRLTSAADGDGEAAGARTGDLAAALDLSPATMTATIKRLADRGLALHTPYRGVELTAAGRRRAMGVIRRHRIVERFLADLLGYSWSEADRLAPTFEHQLPQEVEDRLWVALDRPGTCPHGFPIPGGDDADLPAMPPLYSLAVGDRAVVALPGSTDPDVAAFLDSFGVRPGAEVELREKHPFDGPVVVSVEGTDRTLGEKLARQIMVHDIFRANPSGSTVGAGGVDGVPHLAVGGPAAPGSAAGGPDTPTERGSDRPVTVPRHRSHRPESTKGRT